MTVGLGTLSRWTGNALPLNWERPPPVKPLFLQMDSTNSESILRYPTIS